MKSEDLFVTMPKWFLLTLAVHGNMGDGELPKLIQIWAQNECKRLEIWDEFVLLQKEKTQELEQRLRNVFGDDSIDKLVNEISRVGRAING